MKAMIKRIANYIREGISLLIGFLFKLVASPIIHWSGLDNTDSCPTPEDIERANKLAEELKRKRTK